MFQFFLFKLVHSYCSDRFGVHFSVGTAVATEAAAGAAPRAPSTSHFVICSKTPCTFSMTMKPPTKKGFILDYELRSAFVLYSTHVSSS